MMMGTIIGAGMLGIPYVIARVGIVVGILEIVLIAVAVTYIHLMLGEITLATKESLALPGLARKYLGPFGGVIMACAFLFLTASALTAYSVGSGAVLFELTHFASPSLWGYIFFMIAAGFVALGTRGISRSEVIFVSGLVAILFLILWKSSGHFEYANFFPLSHSSFFLPLGVILFAMGGSATIPELEKILPASGKKIEMAIIAGTLIPAIIYIIFAIVVVGVTGSATTEVATIGLGNRLGKGVLIAGNLFALFAMMTSFLAIGQALTRFFEWDLRFKRMKALCAAMSLPLALLMLGVNDFIKTIGYAGAIGGGIEGVLFVAMFWKARKMGDLAPRGMKVYAPRAVSIFVVLTLLLGISSHFGFL